MAKRPQSAPFSCRDLHWKLVTSVAIITVAAACSPLSGKRGAKARPQPPNIAQKPVKQALVPTNPLHRATAYWAGEYQKKPGDATAALSYARNLKAIGNKERARAILKHAHARHPNHTEIASEYGRLALEAGQVQHALRVLKRAEKPKGKTDWRVLSAQGTAHAKLGDHKAAQRYFIAALQKQPQSASLNNNLALSYAMSGSPDKAETLLRKTISAGHDTAKLRQNLALVLGLQRKFDEAQQVASVDLARDKAAQNMKYLRTMVRERAVAQALPLPARSPSPSNGQHAAPITTASLPAKAPPVAAKTTAPPGKPVQLTSKTRPLPWSTSKSSESQRMAQLDLTSSVPLPQPKPVPSRARAALTVAQSAPSRRPTPAAKPAVAVTPQPMAKAQKPREQEKPQIATKPAAADTRVLAWHTTVEREQTKPRKDKRTSLLYPQLD